MMRHIFSTLGLLITLWMAVEVDLSPVVGGMSQEKKTCMYNGTEFQVGDLITEQVCDRCYCTQWGTMCELMSCPEVRCQDKVRPPGKCCYECPNGLNCPYNGMHGSVLVPETGCTYAPGLVCHCFHDNQHNVMDTLCFPAWPGDNTPACNATTV